MIRDPYGPVPTVRHACDSRIDKFNHHRVKVYHLHVLRFLRSAVAAHTEVHTQRESVRKRGVI